MNKIMDQATINNSNFIKTFALFDLETTGLPELEYFKTKITELTLVAVSVDHFLETSKSQLPRVLHKLTLCLNPFKRIDIKATEVTGLTNEMLEHEKKFDKNTMNLIECFLFQLQQPVCLIAHNGNKFDFPLLKKQQEILEGAFPHSLKCCDSLQVFQKIDELMELKKELLKGNSSSMQQWNDAQDDGLLIKQEQIQPSIYDIDKEFQELVKSELEEIDRIEREDKNLNISSRQMNNETTPNKPTKSTNLQPNEGNNSNGIENRKRAINSKRELFPSPKKWPKGKFTLREIYKRFFEAFPENSHDSEADVVSLLKCAIACKEEFVQIVNELSTDFSEVKKF
jgi:three prime repair exonuclease 1